MENTRADIVEYFAVCFAMTSTLIKVRDCLVSKEGTNDSLDAKAIDKKPMHEH